MTPCNNVITPTMIRKGQVQIGDKIEFEDMAVSPAVSEAVTDPQETIPSANMQSTTTNDMSNDSGVWFRPQAGSTSPSYINPNTAFQSNTTSVPLIYQNMTDYVNSLENNGQQTPIFAVPSSPLMPPEYEQTIDYESIQYMNGFLHTQIGRYMRVEQMIGSDSTEDRYGFLVGVGNNYVLLQDISNGNVAIVDLYTIKYVYMYCGEPIFPNVPFGSSDR